MKTIINLIVFLLITGISYSQSGGLKGKVTDSSTDMGIQDAFVKISPLGYTFFTDKNGEFTVENLPAQEYKLSISYLGHGKKSVNIKIQEDSTLYIIVSIEQSAITLGEILITSTRYEQLAKDVPLPVEVTDYKDILKRTPISASDILKTKAGINLTRDGIWATDINIRGMNRSSIVTLVDGNRIETATDISARLSLFDVNDIERIEVIKGGMSSLYGTGALGGVVNIITKNNFYSQKLSYGGNIISDYNSVNNSTAGNILFHAGADKWFFKLNGTTRKADNIKTPSGELNNSGFKDNYIAGTLGIRPFLNNELKLNYQYYLAKDAGIPGGYPLFPNNALVTYPKEERSLLSGEYKFSHITKMLTEVSAKFYYQYIFRDVENIPNIVQKVFVNGILKKKVSVLSIKPQADHDTKGVTLQTSWLLGKYNFIIGGFDGWQRNLDSRREKEQKIEEYDSTGTILIKTTNLITGERPIPISSFRSLGFFAQDEIRLLKDKFKINLGGRIDQVKVTNEIAYNPEYTITNGVKTEKPAGQIVIWNPNTINDISWSANLGMMYALTKNINVTLNTARSFRSPSLEERYQYIDLGSFVRLGNPELKPENGLFLDAGLKIYSPVLQFTGNGFFNEIKDLVIEIPGTFEGRQAMIKTNAGKSRFYGFDFSFEYNPYKKIVVYGTTSYVRGKDIENNTNLPLIPPLNGTIGVRTAIGKYANIELSLVYFADQKNIASGELATGGYSYYNIYFQTAPFVIQNIKLNLNAGVENIFNRAYRNHLSTNRGTITEEPGRNVFVKLIVGW